MKAPWFGPLQQDEVRVFWLSLDLPAQDLELAWKVLSAEEKRRARRLWRPLSRFRHIACWGQVRWLLGLCLGLAPKALMFAREPLGKPYLLGDQRLAFNLSHSQDKMLLAVAQSREIGVDMEILRPLKELERLARRCLAPSEWQAWQALAEEEQLLAFLRFWTCKEALAKASGQGLSIGLSRLVFALGKGLVAAPEALGPVASWTVHEWVGEAFCAALCARPGGFRAVEYTFKPGWIGAAA
ncbi:4'-phosphopantetheinyl transferase superfamily protein [Methylothermus subterraneus]